MTTKLLCAIDAAYPYRLAIEAAVEMAQLLGVPMTFLTIKPVSQEGTSRPQFWDDRIIAAVDVQLSNVLADAVAIAQRSGLSNFDCAVAASSNIAAAIIDYAQRRGFDHIIVGSSRPAAPFGATYGSVTTELVKSAKCPVTVVR